MDIKQEEERLKKKFKKNRSSVKSRRASTPSTPPCYNIGDIGPGGGIVFALPNTGINNSNFVYEINTDPIQLATTPLALLPNECKNQKLLTIKTRDVGQTVPNNAIVVDYGPGSNNPSFFPSDVNVGDILNAFDINGNGLFSPGVVPTVTLKTLLPNNFVFIAFSAFMNGPANSQPSETVTFYTTPGFVPVNGAEWGGYDRPIITSELFGEGKKNTDIIAAVTQTNNPPSHPTVPSHDIAADLTLAFSQNNLDDWFLPSYEELEEAFNVLGSNGLNVLPNPPGINDEKTVYWTSTGLNPVNNQLAGNVNSNELAWAYITPFNTHILYRKCKTLSVLPVRRFECEVIDKGIQYDYRLNKDGVDWDGTDDTSYFGGDMYAWNQMQFRGAPGVISFLGDTQRKFLDGDNFNFIIQADGFSFGGFSQPSTNYPNGINAGTVVLNPGTQTLINFQFSVGQTLTGFGTTLVSLGPIMYIAPNGNLVFGQNYGGSYVTVSPGIGSNISGVVQETNPLWHPSTFGNSRNEIGRDRLSITCNSRDVRLNNLTELARLWHGSMSSFGYMYNVYVNEPEFQYTEYKEYPLGTYPITFNIKVYTQFEELMGDWDYKLTLRHDSCGADLPCRTFWRGYLVSTNYVNPKYAHPVQTSVVDLTDHFNIPNTNGSAYVSMQPVETQYVNFLTQGVNANAPVIDVLWNNLNTNSTAGQALASNGRGNTLNLENWLSLGINNRATDPNNLSPDWSTDYEKFGWGVICAPCGASRFIWDNTFTNLLLSNCNGLRQRTYMAELPISTPHYILASNPFNTLFGGQPILYSDVCGNLNSGTPTNMGYPNYGGDPNSWDGTIYLSHGENYMLGNGWYDLTVGHPCALPPDITYGGPNYQKALPPTPDHKILTVNSKNKNYDKDINNCFKEINEQIDRNSIEFLIENNKDRTTSENLNIRQSFAINNKKIEETGPFAILGYYPLYDTIKGAVFASPIPLEARDSENTHGYHIHEFNGVEYYMPNGLQMGVTQFHGDYDGQIIEEPKTEITQEVVEQEEEITYIQPQQEVQEQEEPPPLTYTPPPSTPSSSGSSGSGGY